MEKRIDSLVFRRLTYADFRHINKVGGEEQGGGGQSYIDFPTAEVSLKEWYKFLGERTGTGAGGRPQWDFSIHSLSLERDLPQNLRIYQRRPASVSIAAQKIHSRASNRVPAWHPRNGFPEDYNPDLQNLIIYILKTTDSQFWAGWFLESSIPAAWVGNATLKKMFTESAGYFSFRRKIFIDTAEPNWPFYFDAKELQNDIPTEEDKEIEFELEDISPILQENIKENKQPELTERVIKIRQRNNRIVKELKKLYNGRCQITGEKFTFQKVNGEYYCELHHLVPLGENGSDSFANAIIVSPLLHRMLHYAHVSEINLNNIQDNKLTIYINGIEYQIEWHPEHLKIVENAINAED